MGVSLWHVEDVVSWLLDFLQYDFLRKSNICWLKTWIVEILRASDKRARGNSSLQEILHIIVGHTSHKRLNSDYKAPMLQNLDGRQKAMKC